MPIKSIELEDFLVFKGRFTTNFCPGINVIIGSNGTGKTTLIKVFYWWVNNYRYIDWETNPQHRDYFIGIEHYFGGFLEDKRGLTRMPKIVANNDSQINGLYIPEKDILEHAKGLLPFIEQKHTGFSQIYKDFLISAYDTPTKEKSKTQKDVGQKISSIIGGEVFWDDGGGFFYTKKADGERVPFAVEASGYKRLGFLGILLSSGRLEPGSILFWDEPENSLNPDTIPKLVDILLELSRNGVQIFLATHSEIFASYFSVNHQEGDNLLFTSLYKEDGQIKVNAIRDRFDLLEPNNLTAEPVKLYEKEIERGLGGND